MADFVRSGSCIGEPKANALSCMNNGQLSVFSDVILEAKGESGGDFYPLPESHWINKPLEEENNLTLLMVSIEKGLHQYLDILLEAGADASLYNQILGKSPIHVAAAKGDLTSLEYLFRNPRNKADVNALLKSNGQTALHICADKNFVECLRFLTGRIGVNVNIKDKKFGGRTPLKIAAKNGNEEAVRVLIESGADFQNINFDNLPDFDPSSIKNRRIPIVQQTSTSTWERIVKLTNNSGLNHGDPILKSQEVKEFRDLLLETNGSLLNANEIGGYTLLQKAAHEGSPDFVQAILAMDGVDVDKTTQTACVTPLLIACRRKNFKVADILLDENACITFISPEKNEDDIVLGETVLHVILKGGETKEGRQTLQKILEQTSDVKRIINKRDGLRFTPLHYATQYWSQDVVGELLRTGANIGMKNFWEETPIAKISSDTMEDFLDNFCLQSDGDIHQESFEMTFDYSFLAPPLEDLPRAAKNQDLSSLTNGIQMKSKKVDPESQKLSELEEENLLREKMPLPETLCLWYMGQSKDHSHLLKHPVITSFLYLKWDRIRRYFNRNLRFYLLFVFTLTWFIFTKFGGYSIRDPETKEVYGWYGAYIFFAFCMLIYILRDWVRDVTDLYRSEKIKSMNNSDEGRMSCPKMTCYVIFSNWVEVAMILFMTALAIFGTKLLWTALLILTSILVVREFFQVTVSLKRYLVNPENWIEVSMIIIISILLFRPDPVNDPLNRKLSAFVLVLSWAELITLVGKHPNLDRYNVYVTMFYKVVATFFAFLVWYSFFIIAFGLGFYIMLHKDYNPPPPEASEDDYYPFFDDPWMALIKTSTMFVGELEFADIPVKDVQLRGLGYAFFLSFVFLIVVVLMNLLNGLAVSDTGIIQEQAEIVSYISRVETISYTEAVLLGDPFNFLSNWPALKWLLKLPSCSLCALLYRSEVVQKLFNKITGATGILLFYNFLPEKKLTVKPNQDKHDFNCLKVKIMDESIIKAAKKIVMNKSAKHDENTELRERVHSLEDKIDLLVNLLKDKK